jgi:hypothetical protein
MAELTGFNKLLREPITAETSKVVTIDLQLKVGDTKVEITVTGEAPLVQESNATIQYSINQKALDELPIANQSALQVLSLVPGVLGDAGGEQAAVTTGYTTPGGGVSVGGGRMGSTNYLADGVSNNSLFPGRISLSFSTDAIAEVDVKVNNYSAEYGRVGGGIITMTTRSGSNQFHGTLFSFTQNDILNAAPFLNSAVFAAFFYDHRQRGASAGLPSDAEPVHVQHGVSQGISDPRTDPIGFPSRTLRRAQSRLFRH